MKVRAKFRVHSITKTMGYVAAPIEGQPHRRMPAEMATIKMSPVYGNGDPNHENTKFWEASPSGTFELGTVNAAAAAMFNLDGEYFIDITPASIDRGVFELPEGLHIKDEKVADYLSSLCSGLPLSFIKPILVITGPRASGKSRLAQQVLACLKDGPMDVRAQDFPSDEMQLETLVATKGLPLYFEDCREIPFTECLGSGRSLPRRLSFVFVGESVVLPPGLERVAYRIDLGGEEQAKVAD